MSAVTVDLLSLEGAQENPNMHLMPCKINHNGDADVAKFFETSIMKKSPATEIKGSFRGRPLIGESVSVPSGYTGVVMRELHRPFSEDEDRELKVTHKFNEVTRWNLDQPCSSDDTFSKALQYITIAKAIHGPVGEEDSQKSVTGK